MEENIYLNNLYDCYAELLTIKQQELFVSYYFNNFSLGEISANLEVSRNAVFKQLKTISDKLKNYEEKLKLFEKSEILKQITNLNQNAEITKLLKEMEEI